MFSAYYAFHLEYPKPVKNVMLFLQDYVLSFPDGQRRPATYLATASDIKKLSLTNCFSCFSLVLRIFVELNPCFL